jgi:hypothetical protein
MSLSLLEAFYGCCGEHSRAPASRGWVATENKTKMNVLHMYSCSYDKLCFEYVLTSITVKPTSLPRVQQEH